MNTKWITDRLPTKEDSFANQVIIAWDDGSMCMIDYKHVEEGMPWTPIPKPTPYVKTEPKRWTVKRNNHHDEWYLYDGEKEWDRLDGRLTQDAAQRIADIYNEVMP
jgi:hypothetical protein